VLPRNVGDILANPGTKRAHRQTGKNSKGKKNKDGQEEVFAGDPSIPNWNDITAALTPEQVAAQEQVEQSLALGAGGQDGPGRALAPMLLQFLAGGMIATVLWGLRRVRDDGRPRPALWL
jgi:hypothetical protein